MVQRILAAAVTLAVAATGAYAFVAPAGKPSTPGTMLIPVVEPVKKPVIVSKKPPVMIKKAPIFVKKKSPIIVKKSPVFTKKTPIIVKKPSGPIVLKKVPPLVKAKPVMKMPAKFVFVKPHKKHKYYGRLIGGVVLGTILAASVFYAYDLPPEEGLCWYWVNSDRERGYWDYCEPPDEDD